MWKELPKVLKSDFGFQGCIASLELNGVMVDPMKVTSVCTKHDILYPILTLKDALVPSQSVIEGCQGEFHRLNKVTHIPYFLFEDIFQFKWHIYVFIIITVYLYSVVVLSLNIKVFTISQLTFTIWTNRCYLKLWGYKVEKKSNNYIYFVSTW